MILLVIFPQVILYIFPSQKACLNNNWPMVFVLYLWIAGHQLVRWTQTDLVTWLKFKIIWNFIDAYQTSFGDSPSPCVIVFSYSQLYEIQNIIFTGTNIMSELDDPKEWNRRVLKVASRAKMSGPSKSRRSRLLKGRLSGNIKLRRLLQVYSDLLLQNMA